MIPDAAEEQLPPEWQRLVVSYRTNEAPGTIIVQTSERYLYVVQPNGRAIRYGIGVGRMAFNGRGCCASLASKNGQTGHRRPK